MTTGKTPLPHADAHPERDKRGAELWAQRVGMLEEIARELSGELVFASCFDLVLRLDKALQHEDCSIEQLADLIRIDPEASSILMQLSATACFNPDGQPADGLVGALRQLGPKRVQVGTIAVAMKQLLRSRSLACFETLSQQLWRHSIYVASAARVVADRLTHIDPDTALLAGLVHDLGAFYLLYRAAEYEELRIRPETVKYLVFDWHESIGHALLGSLGLSEEITEAVNNHEFVRSLPVQSHTLHDVVLVANVLAARLFADDPGAEAQDLAQTELGAQYSALVDEITALAKELGEQLG